MNVHERDRAGRTPLHYAVGDPPHDLDFIAAQTDPKVAAENFRKANEYKIANTTKLIEAGADVNAADHEGLAPLHAAASRDSVDVVDLLLDAGAQIDAADNKGETPLLKSSHKHHTRRHPDHPLVAGTRGPTPTLPQQTDSVPSSSSSATENPKRRNSSQTCSDTRSTTDMDLQAFIPGRASEFAHTREYELGRIVVSSGRLSIRDPFQPCRDGCVLQVTPASYRAWITAVDSDADRPDRAESYLPAYLSVQLSMAPLSGSTTSTT